MMLIQFMVLIVFAVISNLSAQAEIEWSRMYAGDTEQDGRGVCQTFDGGYIMVGIVESGSVDNLMLIKVDSEGDVEWTKSYGGMDEDKGFFVRQTSDSGYIILGETSSFGAGGEDIWLLKTNSDGDTIWTQTFGDIADDGAGSVEQTADGGYILVGGTRSFGPGEDDLWLIKTDANGDTLWTKIYGGALDDGGASVQILADGDYIIVGGTDSFGSGSEDHGDVWLLKTDAFGDTVWTRTYGNMLHNHGSYVQNVSTGGFIICGKKDYNDDDRDLWLIRTDDTGDTIWTKTHGGPGWDNPKIVEETGDGGFLVAGFTDSYGAGEHDFWAVRTDSSGDILWTETYGYDGKDRCYSAQHTADGGYVLLGRTEYTVGHDHFWLIKLASDSAATRITDKWTFPQNYALFQNYPNPFNPSTLIRYTLPQSKRVLIDVFTSTGQKLETIIDKRVPAGNHHLEFNGASFSSGVYYYRIQAGNFLQVRKMILIK